LAKPKVSKVKVSKSKISKPEAAPLRPVKETFTKSALINLIAEQNDIPRKTALGVFATLESVLLGSVHPRGLESDPSQSAGPQGGNLGPQSRHW
jgi:hypothetical protein